MTITLNNGKQIEIKTIDLSLGQVDYLRIDDPVYGGDCVLYLPLTDIATAEAEIKAALEATEAQTVATAEAARVDVRQSANYRVVQSEKVARLLRAGKVQEALIENGGF